MTELLAIIGVRPIMPFIGLTKPSMALATLLMPLTVPLSVFRQIYVKTPTLIEVLWRVKVLCHCMQFFNDDCPPLPIILDKRQAPLLFMGSRHHGFGEMSDIARNMNANYVNGNSHAPRIVDGLQATMNDMAMMAQAIRGKT